MTETVVGKLEEAFLMGCTDLEACLFAGINRNLLYDYQKKNPEFHDRKEQLKQNPFLQVSRSSCLPLGILRRSTDSVPSGALYRYSFCTQGIA